MTPPERPWVDRRHAAASAVLLGVGVVLAVLASVHATFPGDEWALRRAQSLGGAFEPVAYVFNELDGFLAFILIGAAVLLLARRGRVDTLLAVVFAAAVLRPALQLLKGVVDRPRPAGDFPTFDVADGPSFPSGHVMTAVVMFGVWLLVAPEVLPSRWVLPVRVLAALGIVVMAVARMWAGVHWLSDTYGAVLWAAGAIALAMALRPALGRLTRRAFRRASEAADGRVEA